MTLGDLVKEMAAAGTQQVVVSSIGHPAETMSVNDALNKADPSTPVSQLDQSGSFAVFGDSHIVIRPVPHGADALRDKWTRSRP